MGVVSTLHNNHLVTGFALIFLLAQVQVHFCQNVNQDVNSSTVREKRQVEKLEYVIDVLKQRGLLAQVDPKLLSRVNQVLSKEEGGEEQEQQEEEQEQQEEETIYQSEESSARSIYSPSSRRALFNRYNLGNRKNPLATSSSNFLQRNDAGYSNDDISEPLQARERDRDHRLDCQDVREENRRLQHQLLMLRIRQEELQGEESRSQSVFALSSNSPLDILHQKEEVFPEVDLFSSIKGSEPVDLTPYLDSVLVSPTPTLTTQFQTTSFTTTVTVNETRAVNVNYHGRTIRREIVTSEVKVIPTTEVSTLVSEVTPTPTWSTFTVTPTPPPTPPPPPPPPSVPQFRLSDEYLLREQLLRGGITGIQGRYSPNSQLVLPGSTGAIRANVVEIPANLDSFQSLQEILRRIKESRKEKVMTATDSPEQTVISPSETISIMTVFLSGSKPGEFTTSLSTVTLGGGNRKKREILPTHTQAPEVEVTRSAPLDLRIEEDDIMSLLVELDGSINSLVEKSSIPAVETITSTVTVTVTHHV